MKRLHSNSFPPTTPPRPTGHIRRATTSPHFDQGIDMFSTPPRPTERINPIATTTQSNQAGDEFSTPPRNRVVTANDSFRTPTSVERTSSNKVLDYETWIVDSELNNTPLDKVRLGHDYRLVAGLPQTNTRPLALQTFKLTTENWPTEAPDDETDKFVFDNGKTLRDSNGNFVVKLRAVIDTEGQLILAENGAGSRSIPFHHQLSFSSELRNQEFIEYSLYIKNSWRRVIFAGELGFGKDGLIYYVSNGSGHFKPGVNCFEALWDYLALHPGILADVIQCQEYGEGGKSQNLLVQRKAEIEARAADLSAEKRSLFKPETETEKAYRVAQEQTQIGQGRRSGGTEELSTLMQPPSLFSSPNFGERGERGEGDASFFRPLSRLSFD